jgi:hypothetical protein
MHFYNILRWFFKVIFVGFSGHKNPSPGDDQLIRLRACNSRGKFSSLREK